MYRCNMLCTSPTCPDLPDPAPALAPEFAAVAAATTARRQRGFTLVSALFLLVVLAALGAALSRLTVRQHLGSAAELANARAHQSARAGLEWAAFQVLRNPAPPAAAPACFATTSFSLAGLPDFTVTLTCTRTPGSGPVADGDSALAFFALVANACNSPAAGACPNPASAPPLTYVERQLSWTVAR